MRTLLSLPLCKKLNKYARRAYLPSNRADDNGAFYLLAYAGGTPGTADDDRPDLEAGEQDYTVDFLDGLVVRLVEEEINAFKGETE